MKKIAILLALALALSCCLLMLAACGEEETPADESSSAAPSSEPSSTPSAESSEEETTSEPEETSEPEASEPETSEPEDSEPETSEPETSEPETSEPEPSGGAPESAELAGTPSGDNLALGATVVSGADVNTPAPQYNASLTDGKAAGEISYDGEWFAYWYNTQDVDVESKSNCPGGVAKPTVDLGEVMEIKAARVNVFLGNISGIQGPTKIVFEFSEDGQNWTEFGSKTYPVLTTEDTTVGWVGFEMSEAVDARYVRVSLTVTGACWTFINEIEVY